MKINRVKHEILSSRSPLLKFHNVYFTTGSIWRIKMALASLSSFIHEMNLNKKYKVELGEYFLQPGQLESVSFNKDTCIISNKWFKFFQKKEYTLPEILEFENGWLDPGDWMTDYKQPGRIRAGEHCLFVDHEGKFQAETYFYLIPI